MWICFTWWLGLGFLDSCLAWCMLSFGVALLGGLLVFSVLFWFRRWVFCCVSGFELLVLCVCSLLWGFYADWGLWLVCAVLSGGMLSVVSWLLMVVCFGWRFLLSMGLFFAVYLWCFWSCLTFIVFDS